MKRIIKSLLLVAALACCAVSANAQSSKGTAIRNIRTTSAVKQHDSEKLCNILDNATKEMRLVSDSIQANTILEITQKRLESEVNYNTPVNPAQRDAIINSYVIFFNEFRSAIHNIRQKCINAAKNTKTIDELIDNLDEVILKEM